MIDLAKPMWRMAMCAFIATGILSSGCGASGAFGGPESAPRIISSGEGKRLLLQLPYRFQFHAVTLPDGASGAIAGTALGKHKTVLHFGISFGKDPEAVPVPRVGTVDPYDYSNAAGFVFNDDMEVPGRNESVHPGPQFHTEAQWQEAANIVVGMQQTLCRAATGKPCPI